MNKKLFSVLTATSVVAATVTPFAAAEASTTFTDVTPNTELAEAVNSLVKRGVISGFGDGTYRPDVAITRGQAAKILAGALNIEKGYIDNVYYNDVPEDHPFAKYIYALADNDIVNSAVENFNPDQIVTRSQMAKMISESFKFKKSVEVPFTDIQREEDVNYVGSLYYSGITKGVSDTLFGVNSPVTRGQMAIFIHRAEQTVADSKLVYQAEEFGLEYVRGAVLDYYSDPIIETISADLYSDDQWYGFQATAPGTAYVYIGGFDQGSDGGLEDTPLFYRLDVKEVNNRLVIEKTLLDEPMYEPDYMYINKDVINFTFTYTNGEEVPAEYIDVKDEEDLYKVTLLTGEAELLVTFEYEDGQEEVVAVDYDVKGTSGFLLLGNYIPADHVLTKEYLYDEYGISSVQSVEVLPFINAWDEELPNALESASVINGEIQLQIENEGSNVLLITDEEGNEHEIWFLPNKFGEGFFIE